MKIVGITLVWVGVLFLLKNLEIISVINWNVVWPFLLIIIGSSLKHAKHGMGCAIGGKCGMCDVSDSHKCEGADCDTCKVK